MRAIAIAKFGGREALQIIDLPRPQPGPGEILVQIKAAGVNPVDWKIREGLLQGRLPHQFPITLGWDAAGVIQQVGSDIHDYKVGDEVFAYCRKEIIHDGSYTEYITLTPRHLARKPANLSWEEAAAVPLSALTAYQSLFESILLKKTEVILIHAGAGGVGGYAIQLARETGATIITTASSSNHDYVRRLGAQEAIDYRKDDFVTVLRRRFPHGIDAVFDTVGGETQVKSLKVLKDGGRLTSLLAIQAEVKEQTRYKIGYVFVHPDASQLDKLRDLIETEKLKVQLTTVLPLEQAAKAHEIIETGHAQGKIVLRV
jgi:NADPH2:quinone reductase